MTTYPNPAAGSASAATADRPSPDDVVERLLAEIAAGHGVDPDLWTSDVRFDATVPHWRFRRDSASAVAAELSRWYELPTTVAPVVRRPVPGGVAVEIDLSWVEDGVPHAAHQLHLLTLRDNRIQEHTVFCGGRWPASLLAEMEAENQRAKESSDDR